MANVKCLNTDPSAKKSKIIDNLGVTESSESYDDSSSSYDETSNQNEEEEEEEMTERLGDSESRPTS